MSASEVSDEIICPNGCRGPTRHKRTDQFGLLSRPHLLERYGHRVGDLSKYVAMERRSNALVPVCSGSLGRSVCANSFFFGWFSCRGIR